MKKYFSSLLMFIAIFIGGVPEVKAELPPGSNIGGGVTSTFVACSNGSVMCWNTEPRLNRGRVQAIRVTMVDNTGKILPGTHSVDFFKYDDAASKDTYAALAGRSDVNFYADKNYKNQIVPKTNNRDKAFTSGNYMAAHGSRIIRLEQNAFPVFNGAKSNVLKPYFLKVASKKDGLFESFFKPTFLANLGYDYDANLAAARTNPDLFKNQALLIEPLVFFRLSSTRGGNLNWTRAYFGTVTEVAKMMSSNVSKDPGYTGADVYFDMITPNTTYRGIHFSGDTAFNKDYPLAIYATESRGGLTGIQAWVDQNWANYSAEILTSNGAAAGHVWLNELFCPAPASITNNDLPACCPELVAGDKVNSTNYQKCCPELYAAGKLNSTHLPACCSVLPKTDPLYQSKCTPPKTVDKCDWKIDISCPDNCSNSTKGSVKDIENWDCIFNSQNATRANIRTHYYEWSNQYCQMFCREEVNYQLPQSGFTVLAGHHFTVGFDGSDTWRPIRFEGTSECRTTSDTKKIKYEQFQRDYDAIDRTLPGLWNDYQRELVLDKSRNSASRASSRNCDYYCDDNVKGITCCSKADRDWDDCKYGSPNTCVGGYVDGKYDRCKTTKDTCRGGWDPWYCVQDDTPYDHGYWMTPPSSTLGDYGPYRERGWCTTNGSGNEPSKPSSGSAAAYSRYISAKNRRDALVDDIKKCNDWKRNYDHFLPNVFLDYSEQMYDLYGIELEERTSNTVYTDFYVGNSFSRNSYRRTLNTHKYECSGNRRCTTSSLTYPANDSIRQFVIREVKYELPANTYRYVSKPGGVSSNMRPAGQYIDLGYSNLPVHFSRLPGKYDISLEYTTFGRNHKFNKYVFDGVSFTGDYRDAVRCSTLYDCEYRVKEEIFDCDGPQCKNVNVVFRPISLSNPFPGENAPTGGRAPGENWRWYVHKITRNRGLTDPERIFFDRRPMYEITLNTQSILAIRSHNRTTVGGYSDFNLTCITGTGKECKSTFIRTKFRSLFNTSLCGMSNTWNQCDREDGI